MEKNAYLCAMKTHSINIFGLLTKPNNLLKLIMATIAVIAIAGGIHYAQYPEGYDVPTHDYIKVSDRLSSKQVKCFTQDRNGFIWIGTERGLNRYDGNLYRQYFATNDSLSLPNNDIITMDFMRSHPDWLMTATYNGTGILFPNGQVCSLESTSVAPAEINDSLLLTVNGRTVILHSINADTYKHETLRQFESPHYFDEIVSAQDGTFWTLSSYQADQYDLQFNHLRLVRLNSKNKYSVSIKQDKVLLLTQDGYRTMDLRNGAITNDDVCRFINSYIIDPSLVARSRSLNNNMLTICFTGSSDVLVLDLDKRTARTESFSEFRGSETGGVFVDSNNNTWYGSRNLGFVTHKATCKTFNYISKFSDFFDDTDISSLASRPDGTLLIVTARTNLYLVKPDQTIIKADMKQLPVNYLLHIDLLHNGNLLISSFNELLECAISESGMLSVIHQVRLPYSIMCLFNDSRNRIWAGTREGVYQVDMDNGKYFSIHTQMNRTNVIRELSDGRIIVGSLSSGVSLIDSETFAEDHYNLPQDRPGMFSCRDITQDGKGLIWIATNGMGVQCLDLNTRQVTNYRAQNMCTDVSCILADRVSGHIWMGTLDGLSELDPASGRFQTYYEADGVQGNEFFERCATVIQDSIMVFGGKQGITMFNPANVHPEVSYNLQISNIFANQKLLLHGTNTGGYKAQLADHDKLAITLPYDFSDLNIQLTTLNFGNYSQHAIYYRLEGVDSEWKFAAKSDISYNYIRPGQYTFQAKTVSQRGDTLAELCLEVCVTPPWWKQWWLLWIVYPLLTLLVLSYIIAEISTQIRHHKRIRRSLREKVAIRRMSDMNMRFFTNMAHEFRTPLTLVSGSLSMLHTDSLPEEEQHAHRIIGINVKRMLRLVNQLLDFKKLENDMLRLMVHPCRLSPKMSQIIEMFQNGYQEKSIMLDIQASNLNDTVWIDPNKYEEVVTNLLSNALKYTPTGGRVTITTKLISRTEAMLVSPLSDKDTDQQWLLTSVSDTGIGIQDAVLPFVFDRFYQTPEGATMQNGSGIGLYYCRGLVRLHHGHIKADHNYVADKQQGSTFSFILPVSRASYSESEIDQTRSEALTGDESPEPGNNQQNDIAVTSDSELGNKPRVLFVDDDTEMLRFMKLILQQDFTVITHSSATDAIAAMADIAPDVIISDVMMVDMDGFEFCRHIKGDVAYCHLPVILLTAKVSLEERIQGLNTGADAYVTKPFEPDYLRALIHSMIENRNKVRLLLTSTTSTEAMADPAAEGEPITDTQDIVFMKKLYTYMEQHLSDSELNLPEVLDMAAMSRSKLFYKVKALTGETPNAFFRIYRLNRAAEMIRQGNEKLSFIAELTGFCGSSHFASSFKKQFGCLPSEYK